MGKLDLTDDFKDLLRELLSEGAEFLLVGGHALAVHGYHRQTRDIDIWIRSTPKNAQRVWRALVRFGAPADIFAEEDFCMPTRVIQLGVPPCRIDILNSIEGVDFQAAWQSRTSTPLDDLQVPVIGRAELVRNKRATGRPKDSVDADELERRADPPSATG